MSTADKHECKLPSWPLRIVILPVPRHDCECGKKWIWNSDLGWLRLTIIDDPEGGDISFVTDA